MYGLLLPPDLKGLTLLYIMPGATERSYILNQNTQLKKLQMQFALSIYDLLLPPGIEWLKLLYILPDDNKRSYILKTFC